MIHHTGPIDFLVFDEYTAANHDGQSGAVASTKKTRILSRSGKEVCRSVSELCFCYFGACVYAGKVFVEVFRWKSALVSHGLRRNGSKQARRS